MASIKYFPYGATRSATGALDTEIKFTGQRLDSGVDLYYYGARYYDANIGRFISADTGVQVDAGIRVLTKSMNVSVHPGFPSVDIEPVYPQVLNRYSYALGNPLKYIDPSGQQTVGIGMGFTAGMFGWGVSGSIIYVESQQGGSGFVWSFGAGGFAAKGFGGGGGSAGVIVQYTTADTVEQLRGYSVQTGASGGSGIGAGVEYVGGDAYQGINFNAGIGGGFETHGILEKAGAFIIKSEVGGDN